jgi:GDPmannose 4,6-dehydratase
MWLVFQQQEPDNYMLATGQTTPVQNFVEKSFREVDIEIDWRGGR